MKPKILLASLLMLGSIASPARADFYLQTDGSLNQSESKNIDYGMRPLQSKFSIIGNSITVDPSLLIEGQNINIKLPIINKGPQMTYYGYPENYPSWLIWNGQKFNSELQQNQTGYYEVGFTVGSIPPEAISSTFKISVYSETASYGIPEVTELSTLLNPPTAAPINGQVKVRVAGDNYSEINSSIILSNKTVNFSWEVISEGDTSALVSIANVSFPPGWIKEVQYPQKDCSLISHGDKCTLRARVVFGDIPGSENLYGKLSFNILTRKF